MSERKILTKSGYWITVQNFGKINHIIVRDSNLYPDGDSRSEEHREWLIPINDLDDLKQIGNLILELCQKEN